MTKSARKKLWSLKSVDSILKGKPRGKEKMQFNQYEQKCQKQIEQIKRKMNAISNKKDKEWLRLRQQKIAYELRLRDRREEEKMTN